MYTQQNHNKSTKPPIKKIYTKFQIKCENIELYSMCLTVYTVMHASILFICFRFFYLHFEHKIVIHSHVCDNCVQNSTAVER